MCYETLKLFSLVYRLPYLNMIINKFYSYTLIIELKIYLIFYLINKK